MNNLEVFTKMPEFYAGVKVFVGDTTVSVQIGNKTIRLRKVDVLSWTLPFARQQATKIVRQNNLVLKTEMQTQTPRPRTRARVVPDHVWSYTSETEVLINKVQISAVWATLATLEPNVEPKVKAPRKPRAPRKPAADTTTVTAH